MDRGVCDNPKPGVSSVQVHENSIEFAFKSVIVLDSHENGGLKGENGDLEVQKGESGLNKELTQEQEIKPNHETQNMQENDKRTDRDETRSSGNLINSVHDVVFENVSVMNTHESTCVNEESKSSVKNSKTKVGEEIKDSHVIDLRSNDAQEGSKEKSDGETVCRICHLGSNRSSAATDRFSGNSLNMDLIQIGCGCKEELGIAHVYCAEAWFKLKGNRMCEICGQTAKNITGLGVHSFMEEWNEQRFMDFRDGSSNHRGRCWRGQTFCKFLMACLVIAFVLPWFFRVDVF